MLQDESNSNRRFSIANQCLNLFACNIISIVTSGGCDGRPTNSFKRSGVSSSARLGCYSQLFAGLLTQSLDGLFISCYPG